MTANITFTGLATGIDWTSIINEMVQEDSYQINDMNAEVTNYQNQISSIQGLNTLMSSLDQFVQTVNTPAQFMATTAASSNTGVLTATSDGTATPGSDTVTVGSDIQDVLASQGVAANSTVVSSMAGTMTIYVGSSQINVDVTKYMTLSDLQAAIQNAGSGILTASIINDGSSSNPDRLCITASTGGSSNLVSVTANPTSLNFSDNSINPVTNAADWSGSSQATSGGNYTGSIDKSYTFTVPDGTVGSGNIPVAWSESTTGRSGTITIPDGYTPGTPIAVDGVNAVVEGSGWTGSSQATSSGNYTGTTNQQYTFTVESVNGGTGTGTVGTDQIVVQWQNADDSSSGDITLGAATDATPYSAGTPVDVENGLQIAFSSGTLSTGNSFTVDTEQGPTVSFSAGNLVSGNQFYVNTFSNVDSVQNGTWSGASSVTSTGHYLGSTNKTFNFTVLNNGTLGTDQIGIQWSDTEGNTGVITVPNNYTAGENLDVSQGLQINLGAGNLVAGNTFSINVFSPTIQQGQDSGLAQAESVVHSGFIDESTTPVTSSNATFSYTYGGQPESVSVPAGTTLDQLVNLINTDTGNPGVTASIINDGQGLSTSYHLELTGNNTGAAYTITNIQDTFTGGTFASNGFSVAQQAQNAMLQVNGYPSETSGQYIQESSNSISDLIPGVTLSLVAPGTTNVDISADTSAIQTNIQTLVNDVNSILDYINQATGYNSTTDTAGLMMGNFQYESIQQQINDIMSGPIPGLTDGVDSYTTLGQIGITMDADTGDYQIDSTTLNNALTTNLAGVENLFVQGGTTGTGTTGTGTTGTGLLQILTQTMSQLTDPVSGPLTILLNGDNGMVTDLDNDIQNQQQLVNQYQQNLQAEFASLETSLGQLNLQGQALTSWIDQLSNITPGSGTSSSSSSSGTSTPSSTSSSSGTSTPSSTSSSGTSS